MSRPASAVLRPAVRPAPVFLMTPGPMLAAVVQQPPADVLPRCIGAVETIASTRWISAMRKQRKHSEGVGSKLATAHGRTEPLVRNWYSAKSLAAPIPETLILLVFFW